MINNLKNRPLLNSENQLLLRQYSNTCQVSDRCYLKNLPVTVNSFSHQHHQNQPEMCKVCKRLQQRCARISTCKKSNFKSMYSSKNKQSNKYNDQNFKKNRIFIQKQVQLRHQKSSQKMNSFTVNPIHKRLKTLNNQNSNCFAANTNKNIQWPMKNMLDPTELRNLISKRFKIEINS